MSGLGRKPIEVVLYTTVGCHLCEQALAIAKPLLDLQGCGLTEVDIAFDDGLFDRYGIRIPVLLRRDTGSELGWPFDQEQVSRWLS